MPLSAVFTFVKSLSPLTWLIIALAAVATLQTYRLNSAHADLAAAGSQLTAYQLALGAQNAEVDRLKQLSDERAAAVAAAEANATEIRTEAERRVQRILAANVPKECRAAVRWGAETAAALSQRWSEQ